MVGRADARGAGAKDNHALVAHRGTTGAEGGDRGCEDDGTGALHIVAEGTNLVAILFEDAPGVAGRKILPLQQRIWKQPGYCFDIGVDEGVVPLTANAGVAFADVHRIAQQALAVGADIQHHRDDSRAYEVDGEQFVAIAAGGVSTQTMSANGDMIWAFSLNGAPGNRLRPFAAPKPPPTVREINGTITSTNAITLVDYAFSPVRITVTVGTKVTFTNNGKALHNASSMDGGGWDTGMMGAGKSVGVTFNRPGTYSYACLPHSFMIGQIIVTGSPNDSQPSVVVERGAEAPANAPTMPNMDGHGDRD